MVSDRSDLKRMMLIIERNLMATADLRALLTAADTTATDHRQEPGAVQAPNKQPRT